MKAKFSPEELTQATNARRVLLMVAELHKLGYESLRAFPCLAPSGQFWRCIIAPAFMAVPDHGARLALVVEEDSLPQYSTASGCRYFGLRGSITPATMARRLLRKHPDLGQSGREPDPVYAQWYAATLAHIGPYGVFFAFGDWEPPVGRLLVQFGPEGATLPLPPVSTAED